MPIKIASVAGGTGYANPFVGTPGPFTHVKLDISNMTTDEVDSDGYLKPGVPLKSTGVLMSGAGAEFVYGVVAEAIKVADDNGSLAGDTSDPLVAVCTSGLINRDVAEDNLGRAYTANELAAFIAAGSQFNLTTT